VAVHRREIASVRRLAACKPKRGENVNQMPFDYQSWRDNGNTGLRGLPNGAAGAAPGNLRTEKPISRRNGEGGSGESEYCDYLYQRARIPGIEGDGR
jgi:hypothetical protein